MAARKSFLLRVDAQVWAEVERLAGEELRSVNGQVEYLLRDALRRRGRLSGSQPLPEAGVPGDDDDAGGR
jgi:hypothetical protein